MCILVFSSFYASFNLANIFGFGILILKERNYDSICIFTV